MLGLDSHLEAYLFLQAADMRKSFDTLSALVKNAGLDPVCGKLFIFVGRSRNRAKILYFSRGGYWLISRRLEFGTISVPIPGTNEEVVLTLLIGKLAIPNHVLNKPDVLNEDEFEVMKSHPVLGINLLKEVHFDIPKVYAYILGHHRHSKEIGYPSFKNSHFPESGVIGIADMYDAMRSPKHYGTARTQEEAFEAIEDLSKKCCFDAPLVVAAKHTFQEFNHSLVKRRKVESVVLG